MATPRNVIQNTAKMKVRFVLSKTPKTRDDFFEFGKALMNDMPWNNSEIKMQPEIPNLNSQEIEILKLEVARDFFQAAKNAGHHLSSAYLEYADTKIQACKQAIEIDKLDFDTLLKEYDDIVINHYLEEARAEHKNESDNLSATRNAITSENIAEIITGIRIRLLLNTIAKYEILQKQDKPDENIINKILQCSKRLRNVLHEFEKLEELLGRLDLCSDYITYVAKQVNVQSSVDARGNVYRPSSRATASNLPVEAAPAAAVVASAPIPVVQSQTQQQVAVRVEPIAPNQTQQPGMPYVRLAGSPPAAASRTGVFSNTCPSVVIDIPADPVIRPVEDASANNSWCCCRKRKKT